MIATLPDNTILLRCGTKRIDRRREGALLRKYDGIEVYQQVESELGGFTVVEDDRYTLLLRGHLYCEGCNSIDPDESLRFLLAQVHRRETLDVDRAKVAGGIFALFLIDHRDQTLQVRVDRLGCMPIYYQVMDQDIAFSNNQFIFQTGASVSDGAVCEFLKYGYLPFSDSLFESVHRVLPGQLITVSFGSEPRLSSEQKLYRQYLPPRDRIQSADEAAELLAKALDSYFARFRDGRYVAGLSGGYDSRLICAYLQDFDLSLINFGNPKSREVRLAKKVAQRIRRPIDHFQIPIESVSLYGNRFKELMQSIDSLEDAHVLALVQRVEEKQADYYVDGFHGGEVVGANYYYKLGHGVGSVSRTLLLKDRYDSRPHDIETYVSFLYNDLKRSIRDDLVCGVINTDVQHEIREKASKFVEEHLEWCYTHEDMVESLRHVTRGRCLIAGGPVAMSAVGVCACPFVDHQVFDICMSTAKCVRAGDRLFNALWRCRFPAFVDICKGNTGGCPRDSDRVYRLKHLASAVARRSIYPKLKSLTRGVIDRTEAYSSVEVYARNQTNMEYLHAAIKRSASVLPPRIADALVDRSERMELDPLVFLRFGTLMVYLDR